MGYNEKKKKRNPKNRQTKKVLVFDEDARKEYLTGFKKRKDARRLHGREIAEKKLREEKIRLRMQKKAFEEKVRHQSLPADLEDIAERRVEELPEHTVTITDISTVDLAGQGGVRLGLNKFENEEDSDREEEEPAEGEAGPSVPKNKQQQQELLNHIGKKIKKKAKLLQPKSKSKKGSKKKKPTRTLSKRAKHKIKRLGKKR